MAKAIVMDIAVPGNFTRYILKHLLGHEIDGSDLDDLDSKLSKNLQWLLENDVEDLGVTFVYEATDFYGNKVFKELKENGDDIEVNNSNKNEYVNKFIEMRTKIEVKAQIEALVKGFTSLIPQQLLKIFKAADLGVIISGVSHINLEEMKKTAIFEGVAKDAEIITWLWEILGEFSQDQLAMFLQFTTGLSRLPVDGFASNKVEISLVSMSQDSLPVAHTCSWNIEIPKYSSKDIFREKLLYAMYEGAEGFSMR